MKKSIDEQGYTSYAGELIKKYLRLEGEKQFGEIKQYLTERGISYYDDRGFNQALKSLMKKGEIGKHRVYGKTYQQYFIKTKGLEEIIATAQEFQRSIIHGIIELYPRNVNPRKDVKGLIKTLIHIYGIYNLFVQIKSWEFTDKKKSHNANSAMRGEWLKNTLPLGNESRLLEEGIIDLINNQDFSKIYEDERKQKKISEIERSLKALYESEMEFLDKMFEDSKLKHEQRIKK